MKTKIVLVLAITSSLMSLNLPKLAGNSALSPTLIIINARIHTMDQARPGAEAVAIYVNRVVAIGSSKEINSMKGPQTRVIDAHGQLVLPGFNDAHVHFLSGGFQLASVDLRDANSQEEFA